jgi:hydrogenase nickel incorporation protein HypA/HybF
MHELSLCEGIVEVIQQQAATHSFTRVIAVRLEIGELAAVEVEAMRFAFPVVARHTIVEGARLEIIEIAGQAYCALCDEQVNISSRFDACSACGHYPLTITAGDAMRIKDLEIE